MENVCVMLVKYYSVKVEKLVEIEMIYYCFLKDLLEQLSVLPSLLWSKTFYSVFDDHNKKI